MAEFVGERARRRRRPRSWRLVHAARRGRARLLADARRPARHAHGRRTVRPPPTSSTKRSRRELARIFRDYGEERQARRIAAAIVRRRAEQPFTRTLDLAAVVERALGGRRGAKVHPATRVFQALRIAVNAELEELEAGPRRRRAGAEGRRAPGGGQLPLARRPHRQDLPRRTVGPRRRRLAPRAAARQGAGAELRAALQRRARARPRPRSPPIRAPARPSCAPRSAPPRRPGGPRHEGLRHRSPAGARLPGRRPRGAGDAAWRWR